MTASLGVEKKNSLINHSHDTLTCSNHFRNFLKRGNSSMYLTVEPLARIVHI